MLQYVIGYEIYNLFYIKKKAKLFYQWKYMCYGVNIMRKAADGNLLECWNNKKMNANNHIIITYNNIMSDPNLFSLTALQYN